MNRGKKYSVVTRHTGRSRSDSDGFEDLEGPSLWGAPRGKGVRRTPDERLGGFGGVPRYRLFLFFLSFRVLRGTPVVFGMPLLRGT